MTVNVSWLAGAIIIYGSLHLINYGRWSWGQGNKWGAAGLYLYALITLVVPMFFLIRATM